jgi:beta-glucosidase
MKEGYNTQLRSIVMLKNKNDVLPIQKQKTVYIPKRYRPASSDFLGRPSPETFDYPVNIEILKKYFKLTDNPDEADLALVFIENPKTGIGYKVEDPKKGGNGYFPISLQYEEYTAIDAREISIAGGDPLEDFTNRSYKNKTVTTTNVTDLKMVTDTHAKMKGKPVIVSIAVDNPMVFSEFENIADAIIVGFRVQDQAFLDILTGIEPSGLLPIQMPANMSIVENQAEDVPQDMKGHIDSEGNVYDFAFGLNWSGKITDKRTTLYTK